MQSAMMAVVGHASTRNPTILRPSTDRSPMQRLIRDNRATIVCTVLVAVLLAALWLFLGGKTSGVRGSLVALVHDGDGEVHELPLDRDDALTIATSLGTNVIETRDGKVRMLDADCPNGLCLQQPALSAPGAQIICLPHQLWIEVVPQGSEGGAMDVTLAENVEDDVDLQAR